MPESNSTKFSVGQNVKSNSLEGRIVEVYMNCCQFEGFGLLVSRDDDTGELVGHVIEVDEVDVDEFEIVP
jgi:hypothetical protein